MNERLAQLLEGARLGQQFPDPKRWLALAQLAARRGPRGRPLRLRDSPTSGLISRRSLAQLHTLQSVARAFLQHHRAKPRWEAQAFSMALAALELPPLRELIVRLVHQQGGVLRAQLRLELSDPAVRFTCLVEQQGRGPISVDRSLQCHLSPEAAAPLLRAGTGTVHEVWRALASASLHPRELVRGELGPALPQARLHPLRVLCANAEDAVLSVTLQRFAPDVTRDVWRDPWLAPLPPHPDARLAHERRLFCTRAMEPSLRALAGKDVLVRGV